MNFDISTPEGLKNAIAWQTKLLTTVAEGGHWAVPRSLSVYRISRATKTATKLCGAPEPDISKVFEAMGWTVVDCSEEE